MGPLDKAFVSLTQGQLHVDQSLDMPIFQIMDWKFRKEMNSNRRRTLKMTMVLKRKVTNELMTTYFPTLLLTAITSAITFFEPFFFEAALSVNLTTMLVMTTIFISKMESLPPTSATKMIDYWLILCQLVPFAQVVLLTAIEFFKEKDQEENDKLEEADLADVKASSTTTNIQQVEELDTEPEVLTIPSRVSSVAMLQNIGSLFIHILIITKILK